MRNDRFAAAPCRRGRQALEPSGGVVTTDYPHQLPSRCRLWFRAVGRARACNLTTTAKAVAWAIGAYMHADATGATPSRATIAEDADVSVKTVDREVKVLEHLGLLARAKHSGGRVPNEYVGLIPSSLWGIWPEDLVDRL